MNRQAQQHLDKAAEHLARGDEFYAKAADEIIAAQKADFSLTDDEAGAHFERSGRWVRWLVQWRTSEEPGATPFVEGRAKTLRNEQASTRKVLREAPLEEVERIVADLPAPAAAKLAQASLAKPGVTREIAKNPEASATVTRASGQVREEMETKAKRRGSISKDSGLGALVEVLGTLMIAKRNLSESYTHARDLELTDDQNQAISEVLDEVVLIIDWYRSYLTSGDQSFEDELRKLLS